MPPLRLLRSRENVVQKQPPLKAVVVVAAVAVAAPETRQLRKNPVDKFAPATVSSSEALGHIEKLEQTVKKHHEQTTSMLFEIKSIVANLGGMPAMIKAAEEKTAASAETLEVAGYTSRRGTQATEERNESSSLPDFTENGI
ncbi:hypothetical protein Q1695_008772 [Nippostrongylus brasiliensis]|nr:hypothetical protein Q1695_008772 [Nippostrongylus brasiliensis]